MHKIMFSHMNNPIAGQTKTVQNYISATFPDGHSEVLFTPLSSFETPEALDNICNEYNRHDFLCIHPFNDGNGRMSRLLTTLLLYRSGFYVGRYISLEAIIAKNKSTYYDALGKAGVNWHDENENVLPFLKYILGTVLAAYKAFEDRFSIVEEKLPAVELVRSENLGKNREINGKHLQKW